MDSYQAVTQYPCPVLGEFEEKNYQEQSYICVVIVYLFVFCWGVWKDFSNINIHVFVKTYLKYECVFKSMCTFNNVLLLHPTFSPLKNSIEVRLRIIVHNS